MFTPTASSQFAAGAGLWSVFWSAMYKMETLAKFIKCGRYVKRSKVFDWVGENKAVSMILSETVNFGVHGIDSPSAVTFAMGGTFVNVFVIWVLFPLRSVFCRKPKPSVL